MTWAHRSLERVLRAGLAWRRVEDALAESQTRLETSQTLLDQWEPRAENDRAPPSKPNGADPTA